MNHSDPFYCSRCQRGFPTVQSLFEHRNAHPPEGNADPHQPHHAAAAPLPQPHPPYAMPPPSNRNIHVGVRLDRANPLASAARIENILALQARDRRELMGPNHANLDGQVPPPQVPLNTGPPLPIGIPLPRENNIDPSLRPRSMFVLVPSEMYQARARNRTLHHEDDNNDDGNDGDDSDGGSGAALNLVDLNLRR